MKKIFFATLATLALTACSSEDPILEPQIPSVPEKATEYVFDFNVNCTTGYEDGTRAIKEDWEAGDRIFVFFAQNSNSYLTMTYDGSSWSYDLTGDELNLAESGSVGAAYVPFLPAEKMPYNRGGSYDLFSETLGGVNVLTTKKATYNVLGQKVSANLDLTSLYGESQFYIEGIDETAVLECDARIGEINLGFSAYISETVGIGGVVVTGYNTCRAHSIGSGHAFYFNIHPEKFPTFTLNYKGTEYTYTASKTLENGKAYRLPSLDSGKWTVGNTFAKLDPRVQLASEFNWGDWSNAGSYQIIADASDSEMNAATTKGIKMSPDGFPDVYAYINNRTIKVVTQASKIQIEGDYGCMLFDNLPNVTSIQGINNLDFSKTRFLGRMFSRCESLVEIDLSAFTFENANIVSRMFERCTNLRSVNLSNFAPRDAYQTDGMFYDCPNLQEIRFGKNYVITSRDINNMFYNTATNSSALHIVCTEEIKTVLSNPATGLDTEKVVWHLLSDNVPAEWSYGERLINSYDDEFHEATSVEIEVNATDEQIAQASKANGVRVLSSDFSSAPIYAYLDSDKTLHVITSSVGITMPSVCDRFFASFVNATSIKGIENLDFSNTESMEGMFEGSLNLTELWLGPNFIIPEGCDIWMIFGAIAQESTSCQIHCSAEVWSKFIDPLNSTGLNPANVSHVTY